MMSNLVKAQDFTPEQVNLIKNNYCKGASNDELKLFFYVAKQSGLDPLKRQIYSIPRGNQRTIQVAIDGFRVIAERTGNYAGSSDPILHYDSNKQPQLVKATVTVYKIVNGQKCDFTASAVWDEYNQPRSPMWKKMPTVMLSKCAEAQALRKAFPDALGGMYTHDEMNQADQKTEVVAGPPVPAELPKNKSGQEINKEFVEATIELKQLIDKTNAIDGIGWQKEFKETYNIEDFSEIKHSVLLRVNCMIRWFDD